MTQPADHVHLSGCGCCETPSTDAALYNRPGLSALAYRIGTHSTFLQRMLQRLSSLELPDLPEDEARPLAKLTTRATDDPAIALLDAWAIVADVLTFYQERLANESFLRTATERRSVLELARAIGYELNPGVVASAYLAFTAEDVAGAPAEVVAPQGTQVLSIPGQGQLPQTFETSEELTVRPEWNALKPQLTTAQAIQQGLTQLYLKGTSIQLQPGDAILLVGDERESDPGSERWDVRILQTVHEDTEDGYTLVTWEEGLGHEHPTVEPADNPRVFAFRLRAALFGHNAPDWRIMPSSVKEAFAPTDFASRSDWPVFEIQDNRIDLDNAYAKVVVGGWVVLMKPSYVELYKATTVVTSSRTDYGLTSKVTRIKPDTLEHLSWFGLRDTVVLAQSEELQLYDEPVTSPVEGDEIALEEVVEGLAEGQPIAVSGAVVGGDEEETVSEIVFIDKAPDDGQRTTLQLTGELKNQYVRSTVSINANVVGATHGETVGAEVLGSGDGAKANQQFTLHKPPLTYVSAATASGAKSTLTVRVDGIQWEELPSLYGLEARSEGYIIRIDNDAKAAVIFGDGKQGARLPTGQENVKATYRSGIGPDGEVDAAKLALLPARPQGIRSVTNPEAATGAAAPEELEDARANAPLTVLTLDRIVSLQDYEDFARAFAGIGKAQAVVLWSGETRLVHITIAAEGGGEVSATSELYLNLVAGIDAARDPVQQVRAGSYEPISFAVEAKVLVDPRHVAEDVLADVAAALESAFAFDQRAFGQGITAAEVITVIQQTAGVVAVDLDRLYRTDDPTGPLQTAPASLLEASKAHWEGGEIKPAQLLLIDPTAITLSEMTS